VNDSEGQPGPERDPLDSTRSAAESFDPLKLAALCGGLQLLPSNIHRLWRLQALAAMSLCTPGRTDERDPSVGDLRQLVNAGALGARGAQYEDPYDDVIAEEIAFHMGSFRIGSGTSVEAAGELRRLIKVVLLSSLLPDNRRNELTRTVAAVLHLSDRVLRSAGLLRNMTPPKRESGASIPGATTARRLTASVMFGADGMRDATGTTDLSVIEPLIVPASVAAFTTEQIMEGEPSRWPIRRYGDTLVLAEPFSLALALRHHLILAVLTEVGPEALSEVYGTAVDEDARDALDHLGSRATDRAVTARTADRQWTEFSLRIDSGLQLCCLVVGDGFTGIRPEDPYAMWDRNDALIAAHDYLEAEADDTDDEILGLIVGAPAGGTAFLGTQHAEHVNLRVQVLGLADLVTICLLESGDPLALWKWERAADSITGRVMTWSALDLYSVYRSGERSLSAFAGATFITVAPNSGADMRIEYKTIRDLHGARFVDGTVREICRGEPEEKHSPIYHLRDLDARLILYVAGLPLDMWVIGPSDGVAETWSHVNSVAYWLAQLTDPLRELLVQVASRLSCAAIEVSLADPQAWSSAAPGAGPGEAATIAVTGNSVSLCLGLPIAHLLATPTNEADRLIVDAIARALDALARQHELPGVSKAMIDEAIENVAPLGPKKHLIGLPQEGNEIAELADKPGRLVQEADVSRARELLAEHLRSDGWNDQTIPHERRDEILKDAVAFLFQEACNRLDESSPDGLLGALVLENERLAASSEHRQALLPARLATYPESEADVRDEVANAAKAAVACRFLIEYVTAQPPKGAVPWSLRRFDECAALLAELLDWAYLDDAVHAGLTSTDLLIRDDGQLRLVEIGRYEKGQSGYFDTLVGEMKEASASIFPKRFEVRAQDEARERNATLLRLDEPMAAETGLSVQALVDLLHAAAYLAREADVQLITLTKHEAVAQLSDAIGGDVGAVERAVDYLTLGPRNSFLKPPSGTTRDVQPSRSARRWSYVRRPLLRVDGPDGPTLTWGRRHPLASLRVLIGQLLSGRYQHLAEGSELRAALGEIGSEAGHEFEERVDSLFKARDIKTIIACTSIGNASLSHTDDGNLGDIDVLACDTRQQTLWVVECKDLAGAITTSDIVDEMIEHFGASETTTVARLSARVGWVAERLPAALKAFDRPDPPSHWKVRGVFVTGVPVMAPYITDVPFPIVPVEELVSWLARGKPVQRPKSSVKRRRRRR
jgi:hypothetical protein